MLDRGPNESRDSPFNVTPCKNSTLSLSVRERRHPIGCVGFSICEIGGAANPELFAGCFVSVRKIDVNLQ